MAKIKTIDDLNSVYLVYGTEKYLLDEAVARLKTTFAAAGDLTLNFERFAPPTSADKILNACLTIPFLSDRRLVIVDDFESLAADDKNALADYVKAPSPETTLVLVQSGATKTGKVKVDKRTRLFKAADSAGAAYEFKMDSKEIGRWIKDAFLKRNKVVTDEGVAYLRDFVSSDLRRLDNEIEKITLFADETKKIDVDQVRAAVSPSPETEVFDLIDAVISSDRSGALLLLNRLLTQDDNLGGIFFLLQQQLRLLLKIKAMSGRNDREIAAGLKVSPGRVFFLKKQSGALTETALTSALCAMADADRSRKSGREEPKLIMEKLLVDIC